VSHADQNGGGANGQCAGGPYCSTRDGSPSQNGSGNGDATGKPCAGCVGKADNKNPLGQMPNGSDHNAGYECDGNNGVGKGNPAHTGCVGAASPPSTTTTTRLQTTPQQAQQGGKQQVTTQAAGAPSSPAAPASPPAQAPPTAPAANPPGQIHVKGAQAKLPAARAVAPAARAVTASPSFTG
jgi:hypothetical protein